MKDNSLRDFGPVEEPKGLGCNKPAPFMISYPPYPSEREVKRMEVMMDLNKWDNNDKRIAKRHAETLIELLQDQFLSGPGDVKIKP